VICDDREDEDEAEEMDVGHEELQIFDSEDDEESDASK